MNSKILCTWLGLPDQAWPPDHYTLLGLKAGEGDLAHIEKEVHERMARLRCYQLSHPEEATAGMNVIAQAFISLMEVHAKKSCDRAIPGQHPNGEAGRNGQERRTGADPSAETTSGMAKVKTTVDWSSSPPPVRVAKPPSDTGLPAAAPASASSSTSPAATIAPAPTAAEPPPDKAIPESAPAASPPVAPPPVAPPAPVDPLIEIAQHSLEARRGLTTLPALVERINLTRRLLIAWKQAGRYLGVPKKRLTRRAEENDLTRRLNKVYELMADYPGIVGQPGKPGYRVVAMARLAMTAPMFKMMDETQRKALAQDWGAAHKVLLAHRQFLRQQFKVLRRQGLVRRLVRAFRGAINDHPVRVFFALLLFAAASALFYWWVA